MAEFVQPPAPLGDWCPIRVDRWSFADTGAPIYPEDRFQFAVAESVMKTVGEGNARIEVDSPSAILWWQREQSTFNSLAALKQRSEQNYLNASALRDND